MATYKLAEIEQIIDAEYEHHEPGSTLRVGKYKAEFEVTSGGYGINVTYDGRQIGYKSTINKEVSHGFYYWAKYMMINHVFEGIHDEGEN